MFEPRILAIDLRSQQFGFVVLEGPGKLLDFGRKVCPALGTETSAHMLKKRLIVLLTFFAPSVIVVKHTSGRGDLSPLNRKRAFEIIAQEAAHRSIDVVALKRKDIRLVFQKSGHASKNKIAAVIAEIFPELSWKLPAHRKNWQPEHHNMTIFDAVSLALAYVARFENLIPEVQPLPDTPQADTGVLSPAPADVQPK